MVLYQRRESCPISPKMLMTAKMASTSTNTTLAATVMGSMRSSLAELAASQARW